MCGDDEVLVRVHAASVHPDVWHVVTGRPYVLRLMGAGFLKPRTIVPGIDVAGRVEAVGKNVTAFYVGDEVFGETTRGIQWVNGGAFAEYVSVPSDNLAKKPARLTFEQAAAVPTSGFIALSNVPKQRVKSGQKVLINGAGGGVGVLAVQLAKAYGAEVTAVDSATKLEMLRSVGADHVIDYARDDFTRGRRALRSHRRYPREPLALQHSTRSHPDGQLHTHCSRPLRHGGAPLAGKHTALHQAAPALGVRPPTARRRPLAPKQERSDACVDGAHRSREADSRCRQQLSVERRPRRDPPHGAG